MHRDEINLGKLCHDRIIDMEDAFEEMMSVYTKEHNTIGPQSVVEVTKLKIYNTKTSGPSIKSHHSRIVRKCEISLINDEADIPSESPTNSSSFNINNSDNSPVTSTHIAMKPLTSNWNQKKRVMSENREQEEGILNKVKDFTRNFFRFGKAKESPNPKGRTRGGKRKVVN